MFARTLPLAAAAIGMLFAGNALAGANPDHGTLTESTQTLTFSGALSVSDPSGASCAAAPNSSPSCDEYALTVNVSASFLASHPGTKVRVSLDFDDLDYDLTVLDADDFSTVASGPGDANPEVAEFPVVAGPKDYLVDVQAFTSIGGTYTTTITLVPGVPDADHDGVPDATDACPGTPAGATVDATGCTVTTPSLPEVVLHFHGNTDDACTGNGAADVGACGGPFLKPTAILDAVAPAAHFDQNEAADDATGRTPVDANWTWTVTAPTTIGGYTRIDFWASCNATCVLVGGTWDAKLYKNDTTVVFSAPELEATPSTPDVPSLLSVGFSMPSTTSFAAGDTLTLKLEAHFSDTGAASRIFYDSAAACPGASGTAACDSLVKFNTTPPPPPPPPVPATQASGLAPRYQIHVSPPALGNDAGEPSVGYNKFTKHSMFISYTQALRQTYQEDVLPTPLLPASCDATWEDKSGTLTTVNSLDPILFTDEATGRTFNSQLSGDNSLMEFTDDDGDSWTPAQAGPPNGGADHQTVATGIYPTGFEPPTASWPASGPKRAVYYCSQSVAGAFCSRSDDGSRTFGPGFLFKDTDCAAGALHGHVKVAPDGTVYVPDSSQCIAPTGEVASHVIAFVSENAGQTFTARPVPQSTGGNGSDPSIGIATNGDLYMCYANEDDTVHVAWSSDKGQTWQGGVDVGAMQGLTHTRFPQMIAGDPDRAACAFLGNSGARPESPSTDPNSLDYEGSWYGYIATTYDHGATWHLVNVTPNDPIQGWGGVGPDGTNRNLLDFNDLQIDDIGRTYFAFADGCTGACTRNPALNAFEAKATIVRQTGGRTLFAKYDDTKPSTGVRRFNVSNPIEPAAACTRQDLSKRSVAQSKVFWNAPDTGGSAITNYKVYRADDAAGPFVAIGDSGPKTSYIDTNVSAAVEKYYYYVEAYNAVGVAGISNTIELPITADEVDTCKVPGEVIVQDSTGDAQGGDDLDIVYVGVAETTGKPDAFVITEKIANFTAGVPPPSSFYVMLFPLYGNLWIALDSTNGPATFNYGTFEEDPAGQGFLIYTTVGQLADSSFAPDGTITFVVPRSFFGNPATGADIVGFDARARVGAASANSRDSAGPSSYTVKGIDVCIAPPPPPVVLASLLSDTDHGEAPLTVTFTVSGTPSDGETLKSFSLNFGDGSGNATGNFPSGGSTTVTHTYVADGVYRAKLAVTDSADRTSTNLAEQTLTILPGVGKVGPPGPGNNHLGGALPPATLALLLLGAGWRRRRS